MSAFAPLLKAQQTSNAKALTCFKDTGINRQTQMEPARKGPETLSI